MAGSESKNPMGKAFVARLSKQSSSFHSSGNASKGLQESQLARGVKPSEVKSTECANATRWTGIFRCSNKTRVLAHDICIGLTGQYDGISLEGGAEIEVEEESEDEDEPEDDGAEKGAEEVESDGEQIAANEIAGKEFPLAHRCLPASDFKLNDQL